MAALRSLKEAVSEVSRQTRRPKMRHKPGLAWASVPLLTLGLGAAPAFVYIALRYHRPRYLVPAAAYALATTVAITLIALTQAFTVAVGVALVIVCSGVATAHTLAVRREVSVAGSDNDVQVAAARERLRRRKEARRLVGADPSLALELGIGRPDLPRQFDDGGLVDVNHSPADVLGKILCVDDATAQRIVATRSELGGFTSLDELSVTMDLHPAQLDSVADRLLFLRG
jgi:DNA uptake protein ComE-like DNA-binding protein